MTTCRLCQRSLEEDAFYKKPDGTPRPRCKQCLSDVSRRRYQSDPDLRKRKIAQAKAWGQENPERLKQYTQNSKGRRRATRLKSHFGISLERYNELLEGQGGVCAVCGGTWHKALEVDHDHSCCPGKGSCGKCVRGLLCGSCNRAIGWLGDTPDGLARALQYVSRFLPETANVIELRKVSE